MKETNPSHIISFEELYILHKKHFGKDVKSAAPLTAHGSNRNIIRLEDESGNTSIGIINTHIGENKAFISFGKRFLEQGMDVPEVYETSGDLLTYIMEDLGDTTLLNKITSNQQEFGESETEIYKGVITILPKFQTQAGEGLDYSLCYQFKRFDDDNINSDLNYFKEHFLNNFYKKKLSSNSLRNELDFLRYNLLLLPYNYFLYRDFQSRNIMIKDGKFYFIDFQSGRRGSLLYDIASLLYDARAHIPQQKREQLLEFYLDELEKYITVDRDMMKEKFWYFAVIRIMQAMGAYGYLGIVKGKKNFLESVPYALRNINYILNEKINTNKLKYIKQIFSELLDENGNARE